MNNDVSMLGRTIQNIRKNKEFDRNKLSRLTGIDNLVLYEIENGDISDLSLSDLEKIAKALDVNISTLLEEKVQVDYEKNIDGNAKIDSDVTIYKLIKHIYRGFGINKDYLTDSERLSIVNSLESAINIIESYRNNIWIWIMLIQYRLIKKLGNLILALIYFTSIFSSVSLIYNSESLLL